MVFDSEGCQAFCIAPRSAFAVSSPGSPFLHNVLNLLHKEIHLGTLILHFLVRICAYSIFYMLLPESSHQLKSQEDVQ